MNPKITVIIRTFNSEKTASRVIDSALNQTLDKKLYEILVVDDGSTDETLNIIENNYLGKVRLIKQKHLGSKIGVRRGIRESRGNYVIFLDSDDEFKPKILENMAAAVRANGKIDFVYCDYFEKTGNKIRKVSLKDNIFNSLWCAVLFKKKLFKEIGLAPDYIFFGEYDFLIRLIKYNKKPAYIPKPLYIYTRSKGSMTTDRRKVEAGFEQLRKIYGNIVDKIRKY